MTEISSTSGIIDVVTQTGLAGIIFVIWYVDQRKMDKLSRLIDAQIEDKKKMRADSGILIEMIKDNAKREEQTQELLRQSTHALKGNTMALTKLQKKL